MDNEIVITSIIALIFLALAYTVDWLFIIGAVIIMLRNQSKILKKKKTKNKK